MSEGWLVPGLITWGSFATLYAIGYWWLWSRTKQRYDELKALANQLLAEE